MKPDAHYDDAAFCPCPRCGNPNTYSMAELRNRVSGPTSEFSADLAAWLLPPQRPRRPVSKRHRLGLRNSIAFGMVWVIIFTVACYALTGSAPSIPFAIFTAAVALFIGIRTWRNESKLAANEDKVLLETHWERHRAYLRRRRVWSRLQYCPKCGLVIDPVTLDTRSLYEVHELANSRERGASLR